MYSAKKWLNMKASEIYGIFYFVVYQYFKFNWCFDDVSPHFLYLKENKV